MATVHPSRTPASTADADSGAGAAGEAGRSGTAGAAAEGAEREALGAGTAPSGVLPPRQTPRPGPGLPDAGDIAPGGPSPSRPDTGTSTPGTKSPGGPAGSTDAEEQPTDRAAGKTAPEAPEARKAPGVPERGADPSGRRATDAQGDEKPQRRRMARRPLFVTAAALLAGALLHLIWFRFFASSGGDLAAQDAWAEFVGEHPGSAYNLAWYGGLHPVSYSVISPYLMAVIGVRTTLILSGVLSAGLLALLLARTVHRPLWPSLWGAFAFACNAASGRVTFALGVCFGLGAVAVVWTWPDRWRGARASRLARWTRAVLAILLAVLATAASPVAGLFLEVVAASLLLARRYAAMLSVALPPPLVVACSALLFPFTGVQPMPFVSLVFPVLGAVAVMLLVPKSWVAVRVGAAVYTVGIVLTWAIPSQVGSNVERLGLLFGTVALLAAAPTVVGSGARAWRSRKGVAMLLALVVTIGWQVGKPTWDVLHTTPERAWNRELKPLVQQLRKVDADRARVEVVPVSSHREASALAPYVNLARGWNRQADLERNPLFYDEHLSPERYRDWLRRWAVQYVVLPADPPDLAGGVAEARLVRDGLPYLKEIWSDDSWRLFRVKGAEPMVGKGASVVRADAERVTLRVSRSGPVLVRVPWSPWLGLVDRAGERVEPPSEHGPNRYGCLREAEPTFGGPPPEGEDEPVVDTWTVLDAPRPGTYRLAAPYKLPRGTPCPDGRSGSPADGTPLPSGTADATP